MGIIVFWCNNIHMWNRHLEWSDHVDKTDFACKYRRRGGEDDLMLTHPREIKLEILARGKDLVEMLWKKPKIHGYQYLPEPNIASASINLRLHQHSPHWSLIWAMPAQLISCPRSMPGNEISATFDAMDTGMGPLGCVVWPACRLLTFIHAEPFTWLLTFHLALSCHFLGFTNFSLSLDLWTVTFHLTSDLINSGSSYT